MRCEIFRSLASVLLLLTTVQALAQPGGESTAGVLCKSEDGVDFRFRHVSGEDWELRIINRNDSVALFHVDWNSIPVYDPVSGRGIDFCETVYRYRGIDEKADIGDTRSVTMFAVPANDTLAYSLSVKFRRLMFTAAFRAHAKESRHGWSAFDLSVWNNGRGRRTDSIFITVISEDGQSVRLRRRLTLGSHDIHQDCVHQKLEKGRYHVIAEVPYGHKQEFDIVVD